MNVSVIGAGSWGTALAMLCDRAGHPTRLWGHDPAHIKQLKDSGESPTYLPGVRLSASILPETSLATALEDAELALVVVPSHVMREVMTQAAAFLPLGAPVVSCAKGIENNTLMTMEQVLREVLPAAHHPHLAFLSGPSFAREVAERQPTAVVVATREPPVAETVQQALSTEDFRVYTSSDVVGVEIGGATKNVIALAAGAAYGLGCGHNTRAALITRGIAEMSRLAVAMGADPLTLAGLAGVGDLILTCTGQLSRNRSVGVALGQGRSLEAILSEMNMVAEGIRTTRSIYDLAAQHGVEMPICQAVYGILYEKLTPMEAVATLMARRLRPEQDE